MTKKDNRRYSVKRARRALNAVLDFNANVTGKFVNNSGWGRGLSERELKTKYVDDPRGERNDN